MRRWDPRSPVDLSVTTVKVTTIRDGRHHRSFVLNLTISKSCLEVLYLQVFLTSEFDHGMERLKINGVDSFLLQRSS